MYRYRSKDIQQDIQQVSYQTYMLHRKVSTADTPNIKKKTEDLLLDFRLYNNDQSLRFVEHNYVLQIRLDPANPNVRIRKHQSLICYT